MSLMCLALLLLGLVCDAARFKRSARGEIIMKPRSTTGKPVGIVYVPGGGVKPELYEEALKMWQDDAAAKGMSLWIAITGYWFNLPLPYKVKSNFNSALLALRGNQLPWDADVFYVGHSMGGGASQGVQMELYKEEKISGVILLGSYITRPFFPPLSGDSMTYTAPTLTVGAELNFGAARITRMAEAMYKQSSMTRTHPVVMIEGMNHMQFATGFRKEDLKPEKGEAAAQREVARVSVDFIARELGVGNGALVDRYVRAAKPMLQPIVEAFELEGAKNFNVPNQVDFPGVKCPRGVCADGSRIANEAQKYVVGDDLMQQGRVTLKNNFADLLPIRPGDREGRKPFMTKRGGSIEIQSYVMAPANAGDFKGDTKVPISSEQLAVKMISRQALADKLGQRIEKDGDFCREINEKIYNDAFANAGAKARYRFNRYGQPMEFVASEYTSVGPLWYLGDLEYKEVRGKMQVKSNALFTEPGERAIDGNHYCKLMSPARAMEWIYVDGLKSKLFKIWN